MKHILFFGTILIFLFLNCAPKHLKPPSELKINTNSNPTSTINKKDSFPLNWLENWSGQLNI
jgi:hypothetical protein